MHAAGSQLNGKKAKRRVKSAFRGAARRGAPPLLAHALSRAVPPGSAAPRLARRGPRNSNSQKSQSPTRAGPEKQQAGGTGESPDHLPETATTRHLVHLLSSPDLPFRLLLAIHRPPRAIKPTRAGTPMVVVAVGGGGGGGGGWGTWEELVLGGAVLRHGGAAWAAVADELRTRSPCAFSPEVRTPHPIKP